MAKACGGWRAPEPRRNRLGGQGERMLPAPLGLSQDQPPRIQKCVDSAGLLAGDSAEVAAAESTPDFHLGLRGL